MFGIQNTGKKQQKEVEYLCTCRAYLIDINFTEFSLVMVFIFTLKVDVVGTGYVH